MQQSTSFTAGATQVNEATYGFFELMSPAWIQQLACKVARPPSSITRKGPCEPIPIQPARESVVGVVNPQQACFQPSNQSLTAPI
jgi:hypothetical protein